MNQLSGTKELIFDAFIELTSMAGYENVSIRDIAKRVGINPASLYYHFENKVKILDFAYEYYANHQYDNRQPVEEMCTLIETAKPEVVVRTLAYSFESSDQKEYIRMVLITKIVYMRLFQDPVANALFSESNIENSEYLVKILNHGKSMGRIDADFDSETFADVLIGSLQIMGVKSFSDPTYSVRQLDQESKIIAMLSKFLGAAMKN
ncbi:MAG: TetR/AcrR family transcriptional regulator [Coriobacteriales bacterium]|jgi:AcrR family transcriptional regulator|nr:TetR/AcrR family transcriptional regulator [Coriobacteriales bacterium]